MIPPQVRAIIAATAIAHATGKSVTSIYDYSEGGYKNIEVNVVGTQVTGYDYATSSHFDGTMPILYHYGVGGHVDFKRKDDGKYDGYDYSRSNHFEVNVRGNKAEFYDYGGSGWTTYSV